MKATSFVTDYRFGKRLAEGVVGLASSHGQQLFVRCKLRKATSCALCRVALEPGGQAYKPVTNGYNRMHRLCFGCVAEMEGL